MDVLVIFGKIIPSFEFNGDMPDLKQAFDDWQGAATDDELKARPARPNWSGPSSCQ